MFSFAGQFNDTGQVGLYVGTRAGQPARGDGGRRVRAGARRREPATEAELARAKENAKGRYVLGLESTGARMNRLGGSAVWSTCRC